HPRRPAGCGRRTPAGPRMAARAGRPPSAAPAGGPPCGGRRSPAGPAPRPASAPPRRRPAAPRPGPGRRCRPRHRDRRPPARPRPGSGGPAAAACGRGRGWPAPAPPRRTRRAGRSGCRPRARAARRRRRGRCRTRRRRFRRSSIRCRGSSWAGGWGCGRGGRSRAREGRVPRLRRGGGSRYHTRLAGGNPAACAVPRAGPGPSRPGLPTHRDSYAQRQSPRKRAFRVCPAPLQAHLREGRRAGRNPQARVLREADPGAQAQGRRRREAPGAPHVARRHQAPAPVLRQARVLPLARPARRSRISTKPARASVSGLLSLRHRVARDCPARDTTAPRRFSMTLKQRLTEDMKAAMKSGDKQRLGVIRLANAAIKQREVDERIELDDAAVLAVMEKMVKQRKDSVSQYEAANREDLAAIERAEIEVIQGYLPETLDEAAILAAIDAAIATTGATGPADMGKLMGVLKPKLAGQADMGQVSALLKKKLAG